MTKSKIFLYFCLSFIIGVLLSSVCFMPQLIMLGFLILGILLISVLWQYKKMVVLGFCLLFLVFGIWRHQQALSNIPQVVEQNISFVGVVVAEPNIRQNHTKLTLFDTSSQSIKGKILVSTSKYPAYQYGDKLKVSGKIQAPQVFEDFNYQGYLAKDGIYSVMYFPEIEFVGKDDQSLVSIIYSKILEFKNKLRNSIDQNLSPPQISILAAIILGDKRSISDEWQQKLNVTGVRHITCVSGMHTIILSAILMWLGLRLGLWRGQAFYFAVILLALFIVMVGLPSSAVRAGIMAGIFLLAQKIGRLNSADRAIVFAASLMLIQNPLLLKSDVGFQLSFLAALGIIYLMPVFQYWFQKISIFRFFSSVTSLLAMTLAAQIFTLPILIYNFGYLSRIAPLANILIVPFLPYIMVFGFIFSLAGMFWQPLGWILSFPVWFLLTYLTKIIDWFSGFSWAALVVENVHWLWLAITYLILDRKSVV